MEATFGVRVEVEASVTGRLQVVPNRGGLGEAHTNGGRRDGNRGAAGGARVPL